MGLTCMACVKEDATLFKKPHAACVGWTRVTTITITITGKEEVAIAIEETMNANNNKSSNDNDNYLNKEVTNKIAGRNLHYDK